MSVDSVSRPSGVAAIEIPAFDIGADPERVQRALRLLDDWETGEKLRVLESTAYHEAGHAVVARVLGSEVFEISVVGDPVKRSLGRCRRSRLTLGPAVGSRVASRERHLIEGELLIVAAGPLAERIQGFPNHQTVGAAEIEMGGNVLMFLEPTMGDRERHAYIAWLAARAESLLRAHWVWVERVAGALVAHRQLSGEQFSNLAPDASALPPIVFPWCD